MVGETAAEVRAAFTPLPTKGSFDWVVSWRGRVSQTNQNSGSGSLNVFGAVWSVWLNGGNVLCKVRMNASAWSADIPLVNGAWHTYEVHYACTTTGTIWVDMHHYWTATLSIDGSVVETAGPNPNIFGNEGLWCSPIHTANIGASAAGGTGGPLTIDVANVCSIVNGVVRFYDTCNDGLCEWCSGSGGPNYGRWIYTDPGTGQRAEAVSESTYLSLTANDLWFDYTEGGPGSYVAALDARHNGRRRAHRTHIGRSGAEVRLLGPCVEGFHPWSNPALAYWPRWNPYYTVSDTWHEHGDWKYDDPEWVDPELLNWGKMQAELYGERQPIMSSFGAVDDGDCGILDPLDPNYVTAQPFYRGAPPVTDDEPMFTYHLISREVVGSSLQGRGIVLDNCGINLTGPDFFTGLPTPFPSQRFMPAVAWQSRDDHYGRRAEVMHSEDATACLDPVSGELVLVGLQDRWTDDAYVVSLVRQGVELTQTGPVVCDTPYIMVETMPATSGQHALLIADAIMLPDGALWVAVWSMVPTSLGYSQLDLHLYRQADPNAACVEVEHLANVPRPPFNTLRLAYDQVAGELFAVWNDRTSTGVGRTVRVLQLDPTTVTDHGSWTADDDLPTPPYGAWIEPSAGPQPWYLVDVVIAPSGRWHFRWGWVQGFDPPDFGETEIFASSPKRLEDIQDYYPDPHLLTGHGVDTARDMLELVP